MGEIASQVTSLTIVYSTVYSDADQRKHQSSASLAFVRGIHRSPVNSPYKWPVTRKMYPFDDVIMSVLLSILSYSVMLSGLQKLSALLDPIFHHDLPQELINSWLPTITHTFNGDSASKRFVRKFLSSEYEWCWLGMMVTAILVLRFGQLLLTFHSGQAHSLYYFPITEKGEAFNAKLTTQTPGDVWRHCNFKVFSLLILVSDRVSWHHC